MKVVVTSVLGCGCTEALLNDDGRLVDCIANVGGPGWWCDCVMAEDPDSLCAHAVMLLAEMGWRG